MFARSKENDMSERVEQAINNHKNFRSCSESVLCAFCDEAGINAQEASIAAKPFAGGKMGKCGAVLAAEYVLEKKYGEDAGALKEEFERRFKEMNNTLMCRELKGGLTGKPIRSCRGCVTDAAELLERLLAKEEQNG